MHTFKKTTAIEPW